MLIRGHEVSFQRIGLAVLIVVMAVASVVGWYKPDIPGQTVFLPGKVIPGTEKIKKVVVKVPQIVVLDKTEVTRELELPDNIKTDPAQQITATADTPVHGTDTHVQTVSVTNTTTGATQIVSKQDTPLLSFSPAGGREAGIGYGAGIKDGVQGKAFARWQFLRVGNVYVGVDAAVTSTGNATAGGQVSYRW